MKKIIKEDYCKCNKCGYELNRKYDKIYKYENKILCKSCWLEELCAEEDFIEVV